MPTSSSGLFSAAVAAIRRARPGLVDGKGAALELGAVQAVDRGLCLRVAGHLYEAKATGPAGIAVRRDACGADGTIGSERVLQFALAGIEA